MAVAVVLALLIAATHAVLGADVLEQGESLTWASPPLVSSNSAFTLSLRPFSAAFSNSSLYLAISFSAALLDHPAWVANPNDPASPSASLSLSSGTLTLQDPSFTHPFPVSTSGAGLRAQLLDSGNLVLLNSSSSVVWQSFDHPTDTLLPGQPFGITSQLFSLKRSDSFSSEGRFTMAFDSSGVLKLTYRNNIANADYYASTWPGAGPSSFLQLEQNGSLSIFSSTGVVTSPFVSADYGTNATRRLTLDMDGNLRMYSWDQVSSEWVGVWRAFTDQCTRVMGLCGNYGICVYNPEPSCICPPGFSVADSADLAGGCRPSSPLTECKSTQYVALPATDYPFNDYLNFTRASETECKQKCSSDCKCIGAVYWLNGRCWLKMQAMTNGVGLLAQDKHSYIKISGSNQATLTISDSSTRWSPNTVRWRASPNVTSGGHGQGKTLFVALAAVIGAQLLCFSLLLVFVVRRHANKLRYLKVHGDLENVSGSPIGFSYKDLEAATNNFFHKLGSGGFGTVYKGELENGKVVAVKRLEGISYRDKQFRAEIATIGKIHHINLVRLYGFCAEGDHRLLVYEYMENGSLDAILFDQSCGLLTLDWDTRFQICLGVARGITYLHEECQDYILHCDIKPQNILLDENYCAKVADFGLAYLFSRDHTVKLTTIRGTRGYLAPEWVLNQPITAKVDVFSFGLVLLEVVSGRRNYLYSESAMKETNEKWCFPAWAYERRVEEVVDERMQMGEVDYGQAEVVLKVAFCCIQVDVNARPSMGKVVQMLEGTLPIPEAPRPSFFFDGMTNGQHRHPLLDQNSSSSASSSTLLSSQYISRSHTENLTTASSHSQSRRKRLTTPSFQ